MKKKTTIKARPLMIQGTSSHAGKSLLTVALCRIFARRGLRVAPFKPQNMALNSFVTTSGGEIGRAQALQAEAAGVEPDVDMNPVLLKPTGESVSQVIIQGKVVANMSAVEYHGFKKEAAAFVLESYRNLAERFDAVIIEGAGSPAEINLRAGDIANMGFAEMVDSPVLIVGDIERGGVFASLVGTMELLSPVERDRVKGFIINKFRGDRALLEPALDFLTERTGRGVLGVVPYMDSIRLPDEDGVAIERARAGGWWGELESEEQGIRVAILRLPRISNFTDFDPFRYESGVTLDYIHGAEDIDGLMRADMVIIPGSKNTLADLAWLREQGFEGALRRYVDGGGKLVGICGGFQMLGCTIKDPHGVEGGGGVARGLGLLDIDTVLKRAKRTSRVTATVSGLPWIDGNNGNRIEGYEIHMGRTQSRETPFATINGVDDGAVSPGGRVWGTYIHGLFDDDCFRHTLLKMLRKERGLAEIPQITFSHAKASSIDGFADLVEQSVDIDRIFEIAGLAGLAGLE